MIKMLIRGRKYWLIGVRYKHVVSWYLRVVILMSGHALKRFRRGFISHQEGAPLSSVGGGIYKCVMMPVLVCSESGSKDQWPLTFNTWYLATWESVVFSGSYESAVTFSGRHLCLSVTTIHHSSIDNSSFHVTIATEGIWVSFMCSTSPTPFLNTP